MYGADFLRKLPEENEEQYIWRLGKAKDCGVLNLGWCDIADIINKEFRGDETEFREPSAYRKPYQQAKRFYEAGVFDEEYVKHIRENTNEMIKEKIKAQTEKIELNRWRREESREELILEKFIAAVKELPTLTFPEYICDREYGSRTGVLAFGDEHFGVEFLIKGLAGETLNEYSPSVFYDRMERLLNDTIDIVKRENLTDLSVYSLGDFVDGVLRVGQLMKLKYGVIESTVRYADYISSWLNRLSEHVRVCFQMVNGNHSELRFFNQKKGAFPHENTGEFVREMIKTRLDGNPNFTMVTNPTGLIFENIQGYNVLGIHGEVKNMENAIKDFSNTYGTPINILIGGHIHHHKTETVGMDKEVVNVPSIVGIDSFSMTLNKTSRPGATFLIIEERKGITTEYRIKL